MSFDNREFRDALGAFTTGVCVVTANPHGHSPFGMTVNSFAAVSLEPALVLWSLQYQSLCYEGFDAAEKFTVNVLASDQLQLSNRYASSDSHELAAEHYRLGRSGTPLLRGALASFECNVWARKPGGDHLILIGEVETMEHNSNKQPLLFSRGQYGLLR